MSRSAMIAKMRHAVTTGWQLGRFVQIASHVTRGIDAGDAEAGAGEKVPAWPAGGE